jgi:type II secretory pathway component PulF
MKLAVRRGEELHEAFRATGIYPADFLDALQTGEISGRISETMTVIAKDYDDRAKLWYRGLAMACGALVFLVVVGLLVYMIFYLFFTVYLKGIQDALQPM